MHINRLIEMVFILLNNKIIKAKELADNFEVSTRTIYRDVEVLSSAGIPVVMSKGKNGGISLMEEYTIDKTLLNKEDKENIILALNSLKDSKIVDIDIALAKLAGILKTTNNFIEIDFENWNKTNKDKEKINIIKECILSNKLATFAYCDFKGQNTSRIVEFYKLLFKGGSWYAYGYCRLRKDFRIFKLRRINDMTVLDETFSPAAQQMELNVEYESQLIDVVLKFDSKIAHKAYDDYSIDQIEKIEDGSLIVRTKFPPEPEIIEFLLTYGENLEVVSPDIVKEIIREKAKKIFERYL